MHRSKTLSLSIYCKTTVTVPQEVKDRLKARLARLIQPGDLANFPFLSVIYDPRLPFKAYLDAIVSNNSTSHVSGYGLYAWC
jgi:hypothetical protein